MEDAHIAEGELYAFEAGTKIPLLGHAIFAVYDGHGGTFAAIYSGNNFLRILSKQPRFVQYAKMCASDAATSNRATKMRVLEQAMQQAFVETDYEIGLAVRGKSHVDANSPYHNPPGVRVVPVGTTIATNPSDEASENENDSTNNNQQPSTNSNPTTPNTKPAMAGAAMKAASDHLSAIEDEGDSGTTSCVVVITPDSIVCANAGDSRAVFARRPESHAPASPSNDSNDGAMASTVGKAIPLSFDHKPDDEEEEKRVRNAGGYVTGGRVEGDLAVSRGLGDFRFKQMAVVLNNTQLYPDEDATTEALPAAISSTAAAAQDTGNVPTDMATDDEGDGDDAIAPNKQPLAFPPGDQKVSPIPDVTIHMRNHDLDEYVVVACDGIWDVVSNQQCISELDEIMYAEGERDLGLVSEEILDTCLRYGSKDNMTAIVVQLSGCEKSYAEAAKSAAANSSDDAETKTIPPQQEGVAGRRRKRDEATAPHHQQRGSDGGENHEYVDTTPYGASAPE